MKLPKDLTEQERTYCLGLDVAALSPSNPPQELADIAQRYIKWGLHTPNVHTGLLGVVHASDGGYNVFIRVLFLNVQWTIVENWYPTRESARLAWLQIARALGAPDKVLEKNQ